jgi:two-component system cell cycle sensor histidine kinase/response regulator CckA
VHLDDGRTLWVRDTCSVVRDALGRPIAIQGVLADVTDRTQAELARREIERRYRSLLDNVDVIALTLDVNGCVTFANEAFVRTSGYSREELIGLDWFQTVLPDATREPVRQRFLRDVAAGTVAPRFELGVRTKGGDIRQLLSTNTLLRSADGRPEGTLSVAIDVTERRNLENQLLQQTKLESLGRLAAGVAHDFNNLLTVMLTQVELLLRAPLDATPAKRTTTLQALEQAIEQATELTRSLLMYGRQELERSEPFSVDDLVREARSLLEALAGRDVQVSLSLHAAGARVTFDRARARQALLNLVGNATDATRGHGKSIRIATHVELLQEPDARARGAAAGGSFVVLTVADDGRGIEPRTLPRIFDPFFTTKLDGRGTGLGLAITQTVASQAGGFVDVESTPGTGTTFRVFLPARDARASAAPPRRSEVPPAPGLRVLVVEDLKPIRDAVADSLRTAGYDVITVADTRSATEFLGSTPIDLLITDLHLPDGSGAVLARSARAARPNLRVVIMSGSAKGDEAFDGVLSKPFDEATLLRVVADALAAQ